MKPTHPHALKAMMAGAILTATLAAGAPAQAQTYDPAYSVCLQVYQGFVDYYFECSYTTMAQCQASASGRAASCVVNPYYGYGKGKPGPRRKRAQPY